MYLEGNNNVAMRSDADVSFLFNRESRVLFAIYLDYSIHYDHRVYDTTLTSCSFDELKKSIGEGFLELKDKDFLVFYYGKQNSYKFDIHRLD